MSKKTKMILGGTLTAAAIGGGAVLIAGSDRSSANKSNNPFSGVFQGEVTNQTDLGLLTFDTYVFTLNQSGTSITGTLDTTSILPDCCTVNYIVPVSGTANGTSAVISWGAGEATCQCEAWTYTHMTDEITINVTLEDSTRILRLENGNELVRIAKIRSSISDNMIHHHQVFYGGIEFIRQ